MNVAATSTKKIPFRELVCEEHRPKTFRELLQRIRSWENFDFKRYRAYLEAKKNWRTKMN